jgi:hypothetical protein
MTKKLNSYDKVFGQGFYDATDPQNRIFKYQQGMDGRKKLHVSWWHRGRKDNFVPTITNLREKNSVYKYLLKGSVPRRPIISHNAKICVIGSCSGEHVAEYLREKSPIGKGKPKTQVNTNISHRWPHTTGGVNDRQNVGLFVWGAGFVNCMTILQQIQWALGEIEIDPLEPCRAELRSQVKGPERASTRAFAKKTFLSADAYIISVDVAEVWRDKKTGRVHFSALPQGCVNTRRFKFEMSTVQENIQALDKVYRIIRRHKPKAPIILLISPIPLFATFRKEAALVSNFASKSIIRAAMDVIVQKKDPMLWYWPSHELLYCWFGKNAIQGNGRHLDPKVRYAMMKWFVKYFIKK